MGKRFTANGLEIAPIDIVHYFFQQMGYSTFGILGTDLSTYGPYPTTDMSFALFSLHGIMRSLDQDSPVYASGVSVIENLPGTFTWLIDHYRYNASTRTTAVRCLPGDSRRWTYNFRHTMSNTTLVKFITGIKPPL